MCIVYPWPVPASIPAHHAKRSGSCSLHRAFLHRATPSGLGGVAVCLLYRSKERQKNRTKPEKTKQNGDKHVTYEGVAGYILKRPTYLLPMRLISDLKIHLLEVTG